MFRCHWCCWCFRSNTYFNERIHKISTILKRKLATEKQHHSTEIYYLLLTRATVCNMCVWISTLRKMPNINFIQKNSSEFTEYSLLEPLIAVEFMLSVFLWVSGTLTRRYNNIMVWLNEQNFRGTIVFRWLKFNLSRSTNHL